MTSTHRKRRRKERKTKESKNTTSPPNSPPSHCATRKVSLLAILHSRIPRIRDGRFSRILQTSEGEIASPAGLAVRPALEKNPGECPGELHSKTGGPVPDSRQQACTADPRAVAAQFRRWCARACVSPAGAVLLGRFNMTCHLRLQLMLSVACLGHHLEMRCSQHSHDFQDGRELLIITTSTS